jgi:hypothetical protein
MERKVLNAEINDEGTNAMVILLRVKESTI